MKTPQRKFVVEFKSGRRQTKARTNSIWGDTDLKALVREAEDKAPHLFKSNATPGRPDEGGEGVAPDAMNSASAGGHAGEASLAGASTSLGDGAKVGLPKRNETTVATAEAVEPVQESPPVFQPKKTSGKTPREPVKRGPLRATAHVAMRRNKPRSVEAVTARDTVSLEEVTTLDAENKRLKRLLAERLHAQNLQLKKMLARFDVT
ncbi:hypothetical protein C9413_24505 [Rhizobium sp. SEMIA 4085]|uniref:Uncharacterized protein n=1 Tax=Rhizobium gallicum bv. gallicum R602sp TaxID=1041138 RepID=A0A0B4X9R6_9HYPH|nr:MULTISPECIES: hypothetical protein [Rhizobium]AJD44739.1 hypothetical protein RGR602_PC00701 [Rhizobium gallicum bv. gallicum R602sp]NNH32497.1 hypothetical protein [Rhizobium sp. SEMIA 4085]